MIGLDREMKEAEGVPRRRGERAADGAEDGAPDDATAGVASRMKPR
jgi:hypothetical protein